MSKFKNWSLFLDRDGVINRRFIGDYVVSPDDFTFLENVPAAFKVFSEIFNKIVIVTNQQGIGKGLMTVDDLAKIHQKMESEIQKKGGRIDAVYFAPELAGAKSFLRKPNIGMGLKAKKQFPEIHFKKTIMAGDSLGDMQFGKRLGMITVLIGEDLHISGKYPKMVDLYFPSLYDFSKYISS